MTEDNKNHPDTGNDYRGIAKRLGSYLAAWRLRVCVMGILLAVAGLWLPVAAGIAAGAQGGVRTAALALGCVLGGALSIVFILWPLVRPLSLLDAAFLAERAAPDLKGLATAAVELEQGAGSPARYDPDMLAALMKQTAAAMPSLKIMRPPVAGLLVKIASVAGALVLLSLPALVAIGINGSDVKSFLSPPYLPRPETFELVSVTGDITVPVGGAVKIEVAARGNIKTEPVLVLEREGLEPFEKELAETAREETTRFYTAEIASVAGDMTYRVSAKNFLSELQHIFVVEPPAIKKISLTLTYPDYTQLLPDRREGGGDLRAPFGTKVEFNIEASTDLRRAFILLNGEREIEFTVGDGGVAKGELTVEADARYSVHLRDPGGFANRFPPEYVIESVADGDPEVTLIFPDDDVTVSRVSMLKVRGGARDDYSIASARLHWKVVGTEKKDTMRIPVEPGGEVLFEYAWDLGDIEAYEGDTLEYFLSATDNDRLTGPKTAYSVTRSVHLLSRYEDYEEAREDQEEVISRMEATLREGEMLSEKFRDLARTLDTSPEASKKWRAEAGRAMERQRELEKDLSQLSDSMRDSISRMQNNELVNMDSLSRMQEIDSLMRDIMTDEMKGLMEQVRKNVENVSLKNVDQKLVNAMRDQDRILESLDRTLERLKRIRAEQEMEVLKRQLERLTKREESLLESTRDLEKATGGEPPEGKAAQEAVRQAREQGKIHDETDGVLDSMERLGSDMKQFSPESGREMERLAELGRKKDVTGDMRRAEECLRNGRPGQCAASEEKALETLKQMSSGMEALQNQYSGEMDDEVKKLVRKLLVRTIDISGAHEEALVMSERIIEHQSTSMPGDIIRDIIGEENLALEAVEILERDLARLVVMTMAVSARTPGLAQEAADKLEQAIGFLAEGNPAAALGAQRGGAKKLNRLALALLDAKNKSGMPTPSSAMGDFMDQLQKLAGSQEALNAATMRLGASGIPIPGMSEALQNMALQQKMIGEGLGELSREMKQMGEMGERMGQIRKEMEEIQKALAGGDAGREVQRRQSKVLRRLRDASLSLRKEVLEENRVAETAKDYEAEPPPQVRDLLREALPEDVMKELERFRKEPRPKGYERLIEKYYNELMRGEPVREGSN